MDAKAIDAELKKIDGKKNIPNTAGLDVSGGSEYDKTTSKKGTGSRANLEQNLKTESQADINTTRTFKKNNQTDTRLNKTGRYETPRLFTNRTGYGKVAWRGTDKLALWEMANAVDVILMGATKIDKMTGSVGRVGETTDKPSF